MSFGTNGTVLGKSFYQSLNGLCPFSAREICFRAGVSDKALLAELPAAAKQSVYTAFHQLFASVLDQAFSYRIYRESDVPCEFSVLPYFSMEAVSFQEYDTLSTLLDIFYAKQDVQNKILQNLRISTSSSRRPGAGAQKSRAPGAADGGH